MHVLCTKIHITEVLVEIIINNIFTLLITKIDFNLNYSAEFSESNGQSKLLILVEFPKYSPTSQNEIYIDNGKKKEL